MKEMSSFSKRFELLFLFIGSESVGFIFFNEGVTTKGTFCRGLHKLGKLAAGEIFRPS